MKKEYTTPAVEIIEIQNFAVILGTSQQREETTPGDTPNGGNLGDDDLP